MRRRKYTYEFILSIINEHIETGAGSKVLGSKYGINDARIAEWLKEYHVRGSESFLLLIDYTPADPLHCHY